MKLTNIAPEKSGVISAYSQHHLPFKDVFAHSALNLAVNFLTLSAVLISLTVSKVHSAHAGCDCVAFDDTYQKEYGVFTSPNYPMPYDDSIDCLLYTFIGHSYQIVKISFTLFDLQKPSHTKDCTYSDFVKIYLNVENGLNSKSVYDKIFCGKSETVSIMEDIYSMGSMLIFEFHTDNITSDNTGFNGTFQFLNKSDYEPEGEKLHGTICDYQFVRTDMDDKISGKIFSPNYPSKYPTNTDCAYYFFGKHNERVKLLFESVDLTNDDVSCRYSPNVISVYDGRDAGGPLIAQLCNRESYVEIISSGPDVYIKFRSGLSSSSTGHGFRISYVFEVISRKTEQNFPIITSPLTPTKIKDNHMKRKDIDEDKHLSKDETTESTKVNDCDLWINSDYNKNGTLVSPNYPEPYPTGIYCTYHFIGQGKERIQILFTDFDLYLRTEYGPVRDCEEEDAVMVFITVNGQKERIDNYCGNVLPAQLMSNGPSMTIEFRSVNSSPNVKGFRAIYRFITNFGINADVNDPGSVCGFIFNSSTHSNGSFTSPNYPGLYPRETECHYFFYGHNNERVHIAFAYFDIEGVPPCDSSSASDYLEFSNYRSVDRKMPRHCGMKVPKLIDSEHDFFRIAFKSNDKFDGTGFEAFYQFRQHDESENPIHKMTFSFSLRIHQNNVLFTAVIVYALLIHHRHKQY